MQYFAFVRRDADRQYRASLPDFPGCIAQAGSVGMLPGAIRTVVAEQVARTGQWPAASSAERLPRSDDDHDGYWLLVDVPVPETP